METTEPLLDHAGQLMEAGRLDEAEALCRRILDEHPGHPGARLRLGLVSYRSRRFLAAADAFQRYVDSVGAGGGIGPEVWRAFADSLLALGQWAGAEQALRRALAAGGDEAETWSLFARTLIASDQVDLGLAAARRALGLDPTLASVHKNAALGLLQQQNLADAEAACAAALRLCPDYPEAMAVLASVLLQQGRLDEAEALIGRALAADPSQAEALVVLAQLRLHRGEVGEALAAAAAAIQVRPGLASAHIARSGALRRLGRLDEAEAAARHAVHLRPNAAEVLGSLGNLLLERQRLAEAEAVLRQAIALKPTLSATHNALGQVLFGQARLTEATACFRQALEIRPTLPTAHSNLLVSLNYDPTVDDETLFAEHRRWDACHGLPRAAAAAPHANPRDPDRVLRVGYVSPDFGRHPVGYFVSGVLAAHDPAQVVTHGYSCRTAEDEMTSRIREATAVWRPIGPLSDADLVDRIRADGIDILVDLAGHTGGNRLPAFAVRPAPVQVSWIGYFATTGLAAMDYVVMDGITVPAGGERLFTETVVRLPGNRFCYAPPDYAPAIVPPPGLTRGFITFGSFNNLTKVTGEVARLWVAVLRAVPGSRLLLKWRSLRDEAMAERVRRVFVAEGLDPARLDLRPDSPHPDMLAEYGDIDIALDPFPFCGGLTSCEALWMGVPLVTLPGTRPVSRQTLGFLAVLGLTDLAAAGPADYVAIAAALAADPGRLAALRAGLRQRMRDSVLCDAPRFTRNLEAAYREMWRRWCLG